MRSIFIIEQDFFELPGYPSQMSEAIRHHRLDRHAAALGGFDALASMRRCPQN
jgi:hypothetical protein